MNAPDVELRLPADSAYVAVLRTATAGLAARNDFTLDDIEDLRIAVDEACALVLRQARPGSSLECEFWLQPSTFTVTVNAECEEPQDPPHDNFAWTVLAALASDVTSRVTDDRLSITLTRQAGR